MAREAHHPLGPCNLVSLGLKGEMRKMDSLRLGPALWPCGRRARARGFTLIELLIVLFVAGLISAFVLPSFIGGIRGMRLKGEVKHLAATLRYARSQAVCSKGLAVVRIDLDKRTYQLSVKRRSKPPGVQQGGGALGLGGVVGGLRGAEPQEDSTPIARAQEGKTGSGLTEQAMKKRVLAEGVRFASFTYGDNTYEDGVCNVFFFPRGTSTGGSNEMVGESGRSFVIEIEPVTGSVTIKRSEEY